VLLSAGLLLAGGSGVLGATAVSQGGAQAVRTVTVSVGTGPAGPPGPPGPRGPAGPPGGQICPAGFTLGHVVFVQQGKGPTEIVTCLEE
jgi:hypothetical protein